MNKPFNLEEYKKNPARLRHIHHEIAWHQLLPDDSIAMKAAGEGTPFINNPAACHAYFRLATEYEVRKARPVRNKSGGIIHLWSPNSYLGSTHEWVGPEFEYKVEV